MSPLLAVVFILSLLAQGDTGQLSGMVVDANGAVVVSANVKLTSQSTSQVREVITGESGEFAFPLLPPGRYNVEVSANGFRTVLIDDANVNITQTTTILVHLDAATVAGVVTINADPPLVQQESSQTGRVIEGDTIRQLPLPTRNFQQLLTLSPGTSASVSNNTELGRGDAIISVNGQRARHECDDEHRRACDRQFAGVHRADESLRRLARPQRRRQRRGGHALERQSVSRQRLLLHSQSRAERE